MISGRLQRVLVHMPLRQRSQNLVEYGLSVAAVAFVAMLGFNALGHAQAIYWGAQAQALAAPTPQSTTFARATKTVVVPSAPGGLCDQGTPAHPGDKLQCTAIVTDLNALDQRPRGNVYWYLDGAFLSSCTLGPTGVANVATCTMSAAYTWSVLGTHILYAAYGQPPTPDSNAIQSNNGTSASDLLTFTVTSLYQFTFQCKDSWTPSRTFEVQAGQPMVCSLTILDQATGQGPIPPVDVAVSAISGAGTGNWYIACYSNDADPHAPPDPSPGDPYWGLHDQAYTVLTSVGCKPQPNQPYTCTTQSNGLCANSAAYSLPTSGYCPFSTGCSFVYRRNYDDSGGMLALDKLAAVAATAHQSDTSPNIKLDPDTLNTSTATLLNCTAGAGTAQTSLFSIGHGQPVSTTTLVQTQGQVNASVTCAASVVDVGPNTAFDYPVCISPINLHCAFDAEQASAPFGSVTLSVLDSAQSATGHTYTCNLAHSMPTPPNVASIQPFGAWFDSSWCGNQLRTETNQLVSTINLPLGTWYIQAHYNGSPAHAATPTDPAFGPIAPPVTVIVS